MSSQHIYQDDVKHLINILQHLGDPNSGCPWDQAQTRISLKRNLLEECYEVLEAIDTGDPDKLSEELGDLMIQIAFLSQISKEMELFGLYDVINKANTKLVKRHPHVFGNTKVSDAKDVEHRWDQLKKIDQPNRSPVDTIPNELPSLAYAQLMQDRVARENFEWSEISGVLDKVVEEVEELRDASTHKDRSHELGDLIFTLVNLARWLGIHAEDALRQANQRFRKRFITMERLAAERGLNFATLTTSHKEHLWMEAKVLEITGKNND